MSKIIKSVLYHTNSPVVIKHRTAPPPEPEIVAEPKQQPVVPEIDLEAIRSEAAAILETARTEAEQRLTEAEAKAQEMAQQAYQEAQSQGQQAGHEQGYQEGYEQGRQAALDELQQTKQATLAKAQQLLQTTEQEIAEMYLDAERQIVDIALAVAGKVLARELADNPTTILPIVKEALARVSDQEQITIRVNPEDYEMVLMAKRDLQVMVGKDNAIQITGDYTVALGSCVVETALGTVDARLDTKLEAVYKAIQEVLP